MPLLKLLLLYYVFYVLLFVARLEKQMLLFDTFKKKAVNDLEKVFTVSLRSI